MSKVSMAPGKHGPTRDTGAANVARLVGVIDGIVRSSFHRLHPILETNGVTMAQFQTLHVVSSLERASIGTVAHHLGISSPAVCISVDELEEAGLVRRQRSVMDARTVELSVTSRGRKVEERVRNSVARAIAETINGLPPEEVETALSVFEELVRRFEANTPTHSKQEP